MRRGTARAATPSAPIGAAPTQAQKLAYIAGKLGLSGIKGMQGSLFNIFDTVALTTQTTRQTLSFFVNTSNKSRSFSNLQSGSLQAGEAMVVEEVSFLLLTLSGSDLTSDATSISSAMPLTMATATQYPNKYGFTLGLMNITIANSKVVKDAIAFEQDPVFNPRNTGIATLDTATATNVRYGATKIPLESAPVLPPNQKINLSLEIGVTGTIPANTAIMCVLGRFGSIFASKTTL